MDSSPAGSSVHGDSPGKNTGVGCHALLQGIFPTQGLNPGVPTLQVDFFYHLSHQGSPRILEGVAYPFSRESFRPRNRTRVSCIAGGFFTSWTTREALAWHKRHLLVWSPMPFQHGSSSAFCWVWTELQAVCWASQESCPDGPECMIFRHLVCPVLYSVTGKLLIIFHDSPSSSPLCGVNLDHINIISTSGYITYWLYSFWATRTLWTYIYHRNCLMDEWIRMHNSSRKPA